MTPASAALLDTSVVIDPPCDLADYAASTGVAAVTVGELAFGLYVDDPLVSAERQDRYRRVLADYTPVPYGAAAAHWFGAIAAAVQRSGRNPRGRVADLMIAATAKSVGAAVLTRNPDDFKGVDQIVQVIPVV